VWGDLLLANPRTLQTPKYRSTGCFLLSPQCSIRWGSEQIFFLGKLWICREMATEISALWPNLNRRGATYSAWLT
jgi:hypothetical protein